LLLLPYTLVVSPNGLAKAIPLQNRHGKPLQTVLSFLRKELNPYNKACKLCSAMAFYSAEKYLSKAKRYNWWKAFPFILSYIA